MIKILSFIGSMAGERSGTARYSDQYAVSFKEAAAKNGEEVSSADFLRIGVPFTLTAVLVGSAFTWLVWGM